MFWSQALNLKRLCVRATIGCGLIAFTALPTAAQPGSQPGAIASTPANCVIQLSVANPAPGDQEVPRSLLMSGTAVDDTAPSGNGISTVQVFLGNRDFGGLFLGSTTVGGPTPGTWSLTANFPSNLTGGQNVFVYGTSSVSGQEAFVSIPIVVGGPAGEGTAVSDTAQSFCPTAATAAAAATPAALPTLAPIATAAPTAPLPAPTVALAAPTLAPTVAPAAVAPPAASSPMPVQLAISSLASPPIGFDQTMLVTVAGAEVTMTFTNNTPGVPHNWHLFDGPDSMAATLATTQVITGPGTSESVTFTAPTQQGDYLYWCDVHTTLMTGTFSVSGSQ